MAMSIEMRTAKMMLTRTPTLSSELLSSTPMLRSGCDEGGDGARVLTGDGDNGDGILGDGAVSDGGAGTAIVMLST
eukprot:6207090-Pleurochrysis_carterae.AAC.1